MNVVLRSRDGIVSLIVDEIGDVLEPAAESSEAPPATMPPEKKEIIERVYKLDGKLLLALDATRLLQGLCNGAGHLSSES
jgi:purine-binding chemotaxis protein CheW